MWLDVSSSNVKYITASDFYYNVGTKKVNLFKKVSTFLYQTGYDYVDPHEYT